MVLEKTADSTGGDRCLKEEQKLQRRAEIPKSLRQETRPAYVGSLESGLGSLGGLMGPTYPQIPMHATAARGIVSVTTAPGLGLQAYEMY